MEYQSYDEDQYYDCSLQTSTNYDYSLYHHPYSYYIPDNMVLAVTNPQGEQQLIQTPVQEYHSQGPNIPSTFIQSVSPDSSCLVSFINHNYSSSISPDMWRCIRRQIMMLILASRHIALRENLHIPRAGCKTSEIIPLVSRLLSLQSTEQQLRDSATTFSQVHRHYSVDHLHDLATSPLP